MSSITTQGNSRLGANPTCTLCGAGAIISLNWALAREHRRAQDVERLSAFISWRRLRRGELFQCEACHELWHLDGGCQILTHISPARLPLILEWDRQSIKLREDWKYRLDQIGSTPPDLYGNGTDRRVTPCKVVTILGEQVDPAMVCVQLDAPVEHHMQFRLGIDVAGIEESEFALPFEVRSATSQAEELRMGFSPSLIEMPDGKRFMLNGRTNFMSEHGYAASDARKSKKVDLAAEPPPPFPHSPDITYFVFDGEPGWTSSRTSHDRPKKGTSLLRRLLKR